MHACMQLRALLRRAVQPGPAAAAHPSSHAAPGQDDEDEALLNLPDDDLHTAILSLRSQLPACAQTQPRVVLRSQLLSLRRDVTDMERDLDRLRRDNAIRLFKLSTGADEYAILTTEDFTRIVHEALGSTECPWTDHERGATRGQQPEGSAATAASAATASGVPDRIAEAFCRQVLPSHTDISISHSQLAHLLSNAHQGPSAAAAPGRLPPADVQVSMLMQAGVLSRNTADESAYLLCIPGLGTVVQAISAGRKELMGILKRRQYKEMPERQLLFKTKLRRSQMGMAFHLRDLLGLGLVQRVSTTGGAVVRLVEKK